MRENTATAEPRGFGSTSVAIDLAKRTGSDCGITDIQRERETATKRGKEKQHERHEMRFYEVLCRLKIEQQSAIIRIQSHINP